MPITADWLFQNHTAQQVTIQLLVRALSSTEKSFSRETGLSR